ncbi:MAG: caspase family protein [Pseudomonadota bacterium]
MSISRIISVSVAIFVTVMSASAALAEKRAALVIGNNSYVHAQDLKNPINDAEALAAKLETLGFEVTKGIDLDYDSLRDTVRSFARVAARADITLVYYAGHGISVDGKNYMVPVDASLSDEIDWQFEVYEVAELLELVDRSPGPSLIFLDACRDNPLAQQLASVQGMGSRSLSTRGLSRIPTEELGVTGSVIAYATEPGQVAADGQENNSPFATALLRHIDTPNTDFASITSLITRDVLKLTNGVQQPRFDVSLTGPLMLNEVEEMTPIDVVNKPVEDTSDTVTPQIDPTAMLQVQQAMFEAATASGDINDYKTLLTAFPTGPFAPLAQNAIKRLEAEEAKKEAELALALDTQNGTTTRIIAAPLSLQVTPALALMPSSAATLTQLALSDRQVREVQLRVNLAGHPAGGVDGDYGPSTRRGVTSWQAANGLGATGYLNSGQHQLLIAQTEVAFAQHIDGNPSALEKPKRVSSGSSSAKKTKKNNSNVGAFAAGVAAGVGLGKLFD